MLLTATLLSAALLGSSVDDKCSSSKASHALQETKSIVETAVGNSSFSTLVSALQAADLVGALQGEGPFTVFAPTNEAFAKLPEGQLAELLLPKNKALLQSILSFHVVPAALPAKLVVARKNAASLNGQRIQFQVSDAGVSVSGARVSATDIKCTNGIIHVIDSIIMPSNMDLVATAIEAGSFKTLAAALQAAKLVKALQGEGPFTVFAPTDAAFAALPAGTVEHLLEPENRAQLAAILTLHVVPGRVYSEAVAAGGKFKTLQGQSLETRTHGKQVMVNGAQILSADIETKNGVIHVIDSVLLPE